MKKAIYLLFFIGSLLFTLIVDLSPTISQPVVAEKPTEIVTGDRWLQHLEEDLNPWWLMDTALGDPVGKFPSFRCNNGELVNVSQPCSAFTELGDGFGYITKNLDKNFIVSQSRQVYTYSLAYHLTGNPEFLNLAKAGVDWIHKYGIDSENNGTFTYLQGKEQAPGRPFLKRTSSEQASGLLGMAFYYYLTRDEAVLSDILKLKDFIFKNYYNPELGMMMWFPAQVSLQEDNGQSIRLLSQLDQIYTYLLLLAPILPEPYQSQWKQELVELSEILINKFYNPEYNTFWFQINQEGNNTWPSDYGHPTKAFWMIYLTGKLVNNEKLINFAREKASDFLIKAYDAKTGLWNKGTIFNENGQIMVDPDKKWWVYAELDQMAATLSLEDPTYVDKYLKSTVNWWLENMVDHENHGVWNQLTWPALEKRLPKQYQWKNGFHTHEHLLVGYITAQATQAQTVTLYFARLPGQETEAIRPYYYTGKVTDMKTEPLKLLPEMNKVTVTFTDIK